MLNVWVLERNDAEATNEAIRLITERASQNGLDREMIHWRVLPQARLWQECVAAVKNKLEDKFYPDIIEYPLCWESSFEYLKLFASIEELDLSSRGRWENLAGTLSERSVSSAKGAKILSLPWLVGFMTLSYRKDILRRLGKTPEDLEDYSSWRASLEAVAQLRRKGEAIRALTLENALPGKFTHADCVSSLWWIWSFGGEFLDPLNLAPAFTQIEAVKGLASMIDIFIDSARSSQTHGNFLLSNNYSNVSGFPDHAFCSLGFTMPRSIREGDPRVGSMLPPKANRRVVPTQEYALAVTRDALESKTDAVLNFLDSVFDPKTWVDISQTLGLLPTKGDLWEGFFDCVKDPMVLEVCLASEPFKRRLLDAPFLASLDKIFEETMEDVILKALRDGFSDTNTLAAHLARAASEYRLVVALYGNTHGHQRSIV